MKIIISVIVVVLSSLSVSAQKNVTISRTFKDDNNRLQLIIHVTKDSGIITYNNEFDITGWNKAKTDSLVDSLVDSLQKAPYQKIERSNKDHENYLSKSIHDNGKILSVTIEARKNHNQGIYYKNDFKVDGMNQTQKEFIVDSIMQSLGLQE
jgi:hypothetical protein